MKVATRAAVTIKVAATTRVATSFKAATRAAIAIRKAIRHRADLPMATTRDNSSLKANTDHHDAATLKTKVALAEMPGEAGANSQAASFPVPRSSTVLKSQNGRP